MVGLARPHAACTMWLGGQCGAVAGHFPAFCPPSSVGKACSSQLCHQSPHSGFALGCRARWDSRCPGRFSGQHQCLGTWGFLIPPGSGVPRGRSDGNHLGARSPPPSRAAAVLGGLAPPAPPLPAGRGCWGRGAPTARSPDSLSGPGPWGTLVFNF